MSKRRPEKQLTQDNYDEDDEDNVNDRGSFQVADKVDLARRIIKKAKRSRNLPENPSSSPLVNFSGFSKAPDNSPFSFFNKLSQNVEETPPKTAEPVKTTLPATTDDKKSSDVENLKTLNLSFMKWIQQHLDKNPYVVLVPVFRDYEKHLASLNLGEKKTTVSSASANASTSMAVTTSNFSFNTTSTAPATNFSSGSAPSFPATSTVASSNYFAAPATDNTLSAAGFKSLKTSEFKFFGQDNGTKTSTISNDTATSRSDTAGSALFKFGNTPMNNGEHVQSPVFSFGGASTATPFSFGLAKASTNVPAASSDAPATASEEDPSDEPPQFDFVPVGEDGSVFDIRCKVFLKKEQTFNSIGVGTLFLKPVSGNKTQLIVRADTAQGSVLLNLILTSDLPLQGTGKNNVLLVCIPTPDAKPPPVPVLIRVKTSEERDKLLKEMERLRAS